MVLKSTRAKHSLPWARSRCLAGEASYWLIYLLYVLQHIPFNLLHMLLFLFSMSAQLELRAVTGPLQTGTGVPLVNLNGLSSLKVLTGGNSSFATLA